MSNKDNIEKIYVLTPMQEGMLFHTINDESDAYFTQLFYSIIGQLNIDVFSESLDYLSQRHDILRTAFVHGKTEKPIQVVLKNRKIEFTYNDKSTLDEDDYTAFIKNFRADDFSIGFDMVNKPLIRLTVFKKADDAFDFLWSYHHILLDGWCNSILIEELNYVYKSLINKNKIDLPPTIPFSTYVKWLEKNESKESLSYWRNYLEGYENITEIPKLINTTYKTDTQYKKVLTFSKRKVAFLHKSAKEHNITLNDIFQSIWGILLAKYTNTKDIVYGNVVSGRPTEIEGIELCLGLFINTIPVRITFSDTDTILDLVQKVHAGFIESLPYHYNSLAEVQNESVLKSDLIKHIIAFENYPSEDLEENTEEIGHLTISNLDVFDQTNYDFDIDVEIGETIKVTFFSNSRNYSPDYVKNIASGFELLIMQFIKNPTIKIVDAEVLTQENKNKLLYLFNDKAIDLGNTDPINVRFEKQLSEFKDAIAIEYYGETYSFDLVNKKANQIANLIKSHGINAGDFIGIFMDRTPDLIIAMLAIFKAGVVYVPLDISNPINRTLDYMKDSSLKGLISTEEQLLTLNGEELEDVELKSVICLDSELNIETLEYRHKIKHFSNYRAVLNSATDNPENLNNIDSWAYMLYTSGSTGKPKGAITRHDGAINHILAEYKALELSDGFSFLQSANIASDISVWQILAPLLKGGTVVICNKEDLFDYEKVVSLMETNAVTIAEFVPSYLIGLVGYLQNENIVLNRFPSLQWMMMVGEEVPVNLVNNWLQLFPNCKVLNGYGPCEASDDISQYVITKPLSDAIIKVPIGKPIANMNLFVLDQNEKLLPIGVAGELCVSGIGVGAGYLGEPEKTKHAFRPNPFKNTLGTTMYKTGDLGRWKFDGNLEFLGRIDRQVKIRGNRVELGEVEAYILGTSLVENIRLVAYKDELSYTSLIAFLEGEEDTSSNNMKLVIAEKCQKDLPSYMQPKDFIWVFKLPVNLSDKVDDKKLLSIYKNQQLQNDTTKNSSNSFKTETELKLKTIWEKVLNKKNISPEDNFFMIGGHSLLAMRVKSAIAKNMGIVIEVRTLFENTTIFSLSKYIDAAEVSNSVKEILVIERPEKIPLSYAQESIWFIDQLQGSTAYHIPAVLSLKGDLNIGMLEESLRDIMDRHEVLKSVIKNDKGIPYQKCIDYKTFSITVLTDESHVNSDTFIKKLVSEPFDLANDFKLKATLLKKSEKDLVLVLVMHHVASDGWSESILVEELMKLYASKTKGHDLNLPSLKLQYADYAVWQQNNSDTINEQISYWKEKLDDVTNLQLPTDFERPKVQSIRGKCIETIIPKETVKGLKELSASNGATMFMTLLSAFKVLLYRYTGQNDICVGTPIAGRTHQEFENLIGFFVNALTIRSTIEGNTHFSAVLKQVKNTMLDAFKYQDVPLEKIVELTLAKRDLSRNPLFQVMFTIQNTPELKPLSLGNLDIDFIEQKEIQTNFDLHFIIEENPNKGLVLEIEYCTALFKEATIQRMLGHYINMLSEICKNVKHPIGDLDYISEEEKQLLLNKFNATQLSHPKGETVVSLFRKQIKSTPDNLAVLYGDKQLTYKDLDRLSNELAQYLAANYSIGKGMLVAVILERSDWLIVSFLAILKLGAAYVPIDFNYPEERKKYLLKDSDSKVLINAQFIEAFKLKKELGLKKLLDVVIESQDVAYVIYTSGSTGLPKGVLVTHKNLIHLCVWHQKAFSVTQESRATLFSGIGFDASVWEIYPYLLFGASLHPISENIRYSIEDLQQFLKINNITHSYIPTSLCQSFVNQEILLPNVKVLTGGDSLYLNKPTTMAIYNNYGPTETTVVATSYKVSSTNSGKILIGKPIANASIYIVNTNNLVPIGVIGELWIGGDGVALGYLNRDDLTSRKFIKNPFNENQNSRLYKSGDLGRWLPDGTIEYMGRLDDQVKINGFRVEPSEIENTLRLHPRINDAIVKVMEKDTGSKYLVGYFISKTEITEQQVLEYLKEILPVYMLPAYLIPIEAVPLTKNGKVDKTLLPEPIIKMEYYMPASNLQEVLLVNIWSEMLRIPKEKISITANFFELGGHSLLAMQIISHIQIEIGLKMEVATLFNKPTIRELSEEIFKTKDGNTYQLIPRIEDKLYFEVSKAQYRVWIADQISEDKATYNITSGFKIKGNLEVSVLKKAVLKVIERHEILRTNFVEIDGVLYQKIIPFHKDNYIFDVIDTLNIIEDAKQLLFREETYEFNIETDCLIRFKILTDGTQNVLILNLHHIIGDAWSTMVLQNDVLQYYEVLLEKTKLYLKPLDIQYKEYAAWHNKNLLETDNTTEKFWKNTLEGASQRAELPLDYERPFIRSVAAKSIHFFFSDEQSILIREFAKTNGSGQFMVIQTLLKLFLSQYLNTLDIIIGTPTTGRNHPQLENQIGFYINMLALRTQLSNEETFSSLLQKITAGTNDAFKHQFYPYDLIVNKLKIARDLSKNELFDIVISYMEDVENKEEISHIEFVELEVKNVNERNKYDLTFSFEASAINGISGSIIYNTSLFKDESIKFLKSQLLSLVEHALKYPNKPFNEYKHSKKKESRLINDFM